MTVPAGLALAGAGLSAFGQYQAGQEEAATAKYNQQVKEREAQAEEQRAIIESRRQAQEAARQMATLKTQIGASGAVSSAGAPLEIVREQARQSELEGLTIGYEGTKASERLRQEGRMIARAGRRARSASRIQAGTTLLKGFGGAFK
jgi:uncharacterized protein HemX